MNAATETTVEDRPDDHFGLCPECHKTDGYFNIGREHYYHCKQHRTVWHVGSNLFSSWHDETDEDWQKNRTDFAAYRAAEPYFYPRPTSSEDAGNACESSASREIRARTLLHAAESPLRQFLRIEGLTDDDPCIDHGREYNLRRSIAEVRVQILAGTEKATAQRLLTQIIAYVAEISDGAFEAAEVSDEPLPF